MRQSDKFQMFLDAMSEFVTDAENAIGVCDPEDPTSIEECLSDVRRAVSEMTWQLRRVDRPRMED